MIVMCEGCETSFQVEDRLIKPTGSKVRCSKCRHVFVAYPPAALSVPEEPLILSDELPSGSPGGRAEELPDIGSQIDALFADDLAVGKEASADEEPELLDVDDLLAEDSPPASAFTGETAPADLDLDLDLSFDEDQTDKESPSELAAPPAAGDAPVPDFSLDSAPVEDGAAGDTLPSLDDLGIQLDALEQVEEPAASDADLLAATDEPRPGEPDLELDFAALIDESAPDMPPETVEPPVAEALADQPSDAPVEPDAAEGLVESPPAGETELDLSDLEAMLEGHPAEEQAASGADAGIDLNLDADDMLVDESEKSEAAEELDLASIVGENVAADLDGATESVSADIDLALDVEDEPAPGPHAAAAVESPEDELDFSDITNILEEPPIESETAADAGPLAMDLMPGDESPPAEAPDAEPAAERPDGVLLDLESLLEDEAEEEAASKPKSAEINEELDLDFAVGAAPEATDDLEIEIEPAVEETAHEAPAEAAVAAYAFDDPSAAATDRLGAEEAGMAAAGATDVMDMASAAEAAALSTAAPPRSGLRKYLLIAAGVVVLAIAAVVVPRSLGIQIPFLSELEVPFLDKLFQSAPEDTAGNLKMAPLSEKLVAEFIDHPGAGRLCVVKGQVRNNYDHPRSAIQVTAKLYTKDKTLAKTATVYAGNVFSNQELAGQDMAAISARLKNKAGDNNMNVDVKPGRTIPFMAVFDQLPNNLDEYSVEVAGSTK